MNFPSTHPYWIWMYFGVFGTAGTVLFILTMWTVAKLRKKSDQKLRLALRLNLLGYMFLFIASWFACGIGGPPGNLLSADSVTHNNLAALGAATMAMFFSVPGWCFVFLGYRSILKIILLDANLEDALRQNETNNSG